MPLPRPIDKLHYLVGLEGFTVNEPTTKQITDEILSLNGKEKCYVAVSIADHTVSIRGGNKGRVIAHCSSFDLAKREWKRKLLVCSDQAIDGKVIKITYQGEVDTVPFQETVTKEDALNVALALYQERGWPPAPEGTMWK